MENVPLWHERDISHSSVERVIAPDATIALDFMLRRMTYVIGNLCVYPENMRRNLEKSGGTVYSEKILLALVEQRRRARCRAIAWCSATRSRSAGKAAI